MTLDALAPGEAAVIVSVEVDDRPLGEHLAALGLIPGTQIQVEEHAPFGGPRLVRVGAARYALGRDIAARIVVQET
jgi:Fe2+ transport system protein FeoA